jgi:hypothetical protein
LISFARSVVSGYSAMVSGCTSVRRKVSEVVRQRVELQADGVRVKRAARQTRPFDGVLAFFDALLAGAALVVEPDDIRRLQAKARNNEPDAREEFTMVPFDLGDYPARPRPTRRLVPETLIEALGVMIGRPTGRSRM